MTASKHKSPLLHCKIEDIVALVNGTRTASALGLDGLHFSLDTWLALVTMVRNATTGAALDLSEHDALAQALINLGFPVPKLDKYNGYIDSLRTKMQRQLDAVKRAKRGKLRHVDLSAKLAYTPSPPPLYQGEEMDKQSQQMNKKRKRDSVVRNAYTVPSSRDADDKRHASELAEKDRQID
jgi:hypothetical protein